MGKKQTHLYRLVLLEIGIFLTVLLLIGTGTTNAVKEHVMSTVLDKSTTQYKATFYVYDAQKTTPVKITSFSALRKYLVKTYNAPTSIFKLSEARYQQCSEFLGAELTGDLLDKLQECKCSAQVEENSSAQEIMYDFVFESTELGVRIYVQLPTCE